MSIALLVPYAGAIPSYTDLQNEVNSWLDRDDLAAKVPTFIAMVEARINRDLRLPEMEHETDLSAKGETVALPDDFLAMRTLYIEGSPDRPLRAMAPNAVAANYNGAAGTPTAYVQNARKSLQLVPPPTGDLLLRMRYYKRLEPLSDSNPRNWLLMYHPGVYLYGGLAYATAFLQDKEAVALWASAYEEEIAGIESAAKRDRYGSGPLSPSTVSQVRGAKC